MSAIRFRHGCCQKLRRQDRECFLSDQAFRFNKMAQSSDCGEDSNSEGRFEVMRKNEEGKIGWILLWVLGIPLPILLILYVLRGCT